MLEAGAFRFVEELDWVADICSHPALAAVRTQVPQHWRAAAAKAGAWDGTVAGEDQLLAQETHPEAWTAVAQGLALFGATRAFNVAVTGTEAERLHAFKQTMHALHQRIELLVNLPLSRVDRLILETEARRLAAQAEGGSHA